MVCPINQAFALKQNLPHAELIICPKSGHSAFEPEILSALIHSTQEYAKPLS
jgi:proline iminopeptidase